MSSDQLETAIGMLRQARHVTVLTGSGISAESGVPTYRGTNGLWKGFGAGDVASAEGFARDPLRVWNWHNERRLTLRDVHPNGAHHALARLEAHLSAIGGSLVLTTQNIDGLHQSAGSRNVLELHGSLLEIRCVACSHHRFLGFEEVEGLPGCRNCGGIMRPAIVWFGENLPDEPWQTALGAAESCDLFMIIGTSGVVYPATGLVGVAARAGARTMEINLEPTPVSPVVHLAIHAKAGDVLPRIVEAVTK